MTVRILLVDDHSLVRQGLARLIESQDNWVVCGESGDGLAAVKTAIQLKPDVVVMDIGLPKLNGHEATIQILDQLPKTKILVVSAHTDAGLVGRMLKAGAKAYVPKDSTYEELVMAVEAVLNEKTYVSPEVTGFIVEEFIMDEGRKSKQGIDLLTATERMVLQLIASGLQTKEIATQMHVSPRTVESHRRKILSKLDASGVADLTRIAIRHGLVELDK